MGIGLATALYVAATLAVMGLEPPERLAASSAPFADAAASLWGPRAGKWIAVGAFISCLGALNGWILVAGRMPLALARDALLPAWFARESESYGQRWLAARAEVRRDSAALSPPSAA